MSIIIYSRRLPKFLDIRPLLSLSDQIAGANALLKISLRIYIVSYPANSKQVFGFFMDFLVVEILLIVEMQVTFAKIGQTSMVPGLMKEPPDHPFAAQRVPIDNFGVNDDRIFKIFRARYRRLQIGVQIVCVPLDLVLRNTQYSLYNLYAPIFTNITDIIIRPPRPGPDKSPMAHGV